MQIEAKIADYIRNYSLIQPGDRVLLGLSGGPDSVCLFHVLKGLRRKLQFTLYAGHLDHGLRPESGRDRLFCEKLCAGFRIPFYAEQAGLNSGASENQARCTRYEFFRKAAQNFSCHAVATGHNLGDQAETVLLNLIRGTGLQGLSGIPPSRPLLPGSDLRLIRPLLPVSRTEIRQFLKTRKFASVNDLSNQDDKYRRNLVRRSLMPLLETLNPRIAETLFQTAEIVRADYQCLSGQAALFLKKAQRHKGTEAPSGESGPPGESPKQVVAGFSLRPPTGYEFSLAEFKNLPVSLQREVIRQAVSALNRNPYRTNYETVESVRGFFLAGQANEMPLAGGITAGRRNNRLALHGRRK